MHISCIGMMNTEREIFSSQDLLGVEKYPKTMFRIK